ncbi:hypothetical protein [Elizabethkingia anophelis]|uniref:hypothetical protein n=1 Tax=Elizabethkingia anophelis TaxID=1117645 RepID=UPI003892B679
MVTIINYKLRQKEDGSTFYVLEVQGGISYRSRYIHIFKTGDQDTGTDHRDQWNTRSYKSR